MRNFFIIVSNSDEILFDDIYELHEVIGKIPKILIRKWQFLTLDDFGILEEFRIEFLKNLE